MGTRRSDYETEVAVLATLLALSLTGLALASGKSYPTKFPEFKYKAKGGEAFFKGRINSPNRKCLKGRKILLVRVLNGREQRKGRW